MTSKDIIEMARESGFVDWTLHNRLESKEEVLECFAKLVRAAALEEAVRLLQSRDMGDCTREDAEALRCALAVRSLIEKKSA